MRSGSGFHRVSVIAAAAAAALLMAAFMLPSRFIGSMTDGIIQNVQGARSAVLSGDAEGAKGFISSARRILDESMDTAKLILLHSELDELEKALLTAQDLAALGQSDNLICELDHAISTAEHIREAEKLSIYNVM